MNTREIIEWNECVWWEHERVLTASKDGEEIYGCGVPVCVGINESVYLAIISFIQDAY